MWRRACPDHRHFVNYKRLMARACLGSVPSARGLSRSRVWCCNDWLRSCTPRCVLCPLPWWTPRRIQDVGVIRTSVTREQARETSTSSSTSLSSLAKEYPARNRKRFLSLALSVHGREHPVGFTLGWIRHTYVLFHRRTSMRVHYSKEPKERPRERETKTLR